MFLAHVLNVCKDYVICDLAETYHIYDYEGLPPAKVAILVLGLRDDSRTKMKLSGAKITVDQMLLAMIADSLHFISWTKTKDARKGKYKQKSILKTLQGEYSNANDDLISFETVEEFEEYMKQFDK